MNQGLVEPVSVSKEVTLRLLSLSFNLPLQPRDIPQWRGAWAQLAGRQNDLFHNHDGETAYHYRYPLVQYRVQGQRAALVAFNEGIEAVQRVLAAKDWVIQWKGAPFELRLEDLQLREPQLSFVESPLKYRIRCWLPFSQKNFDKWLAAEALLEQVALLNGILVGQLLCFFSGMGWQVPQRLEADILSIDRVGKVEVHGTMRPTFEVTFRSNVALPAYLALGKAVALGFGQTSPCRNLAGRQRAKELKNGALVLPY
ncbi:MAG: CRISPR-associated endonuclease Cas6 [Saprospiraceae bacterium]